MSTKTHKQKIVIAVRGEFLAFYGILLLLFEKYKFKRNRNEIKNAQRVEEYEYIKKSSIELFG